MGDLTWLDLKRARDVRETPSVIHGVELVRTVSEPTSRDNANGNVVYSLRYIQLPNSIIDNQD